MDPSCQSPERRPARWPALLFYVVSWLAIGAAVAGVVIALLHGADDEAELPPVRATELARAADAADCRLRRGGQRASAAPAVEGPRARPARVGTYTRTVPEAGLVGAMRRGAIVIYYRRDLGEDDVEQLETLQGTQPRATILVPHERMPYRLAATGWRRLLGCPQLTARALDAIRLFRGRYVGQGPEAGSEGQRR
jgi:Protein of unknown function (DUF3105)